MIVLKVGGSLFDHPRLIQGLAQYIQSCASESDQILIVPGGGRMADEVRHWHHVHSLSEDQAHWLALRTLSVSARLLATIHHDIPIVSHPLQTVVRTHSPSICILDPFDYCQHNDTLPHSWDVTSDSIAAQAAGIAQAEKLILLKSIDIPSQVSWEQAAENGWVDCYFPKLLRSNKLIATSVNFRQFLDRFFCN